MTIDLKDEIADGEFFRRVGADPVGVELRDLVDSTTTTVDTATAGEAKIEVLPDLLIDSLQMGGHVTLFSARAATIVPLPACTYANGTSGQGATLTGDANGALAAIDFVTLAAGDRLVVRSQSSALQNGLYEVTTLGTGSVPFVLTRCPGADVAANLADGVAVFISEGTNCAGSMLYTQGTITMGTTAINWSGRRRTGATPGDIFFGASRNQRRYSTDFEELETAIPANSANVRMPGTAFGFYVSNTTASTITQAGGTDVVPGAASLVSGTDTAASLLIRAGQTSFTFSSDSTFRMFTRLKLSALSDGTNTYTVRAGCMLSTSFIAATAPTAGVYFEAPASGGNWLAVCATGSTGLGGVDTGVATSTSYINLAIHFEPISGEARFYTYASSAWSLVATITTNVPTGSVVPGIMFLKTAGSTSRSVNVDRFDCVHLESRNNFQMVP